MELTKYKQTFPVRLTLYIKLVFTIKVKATGDNGCENEVTYEVKNVSNPAGGIGKSRRYE